ncbi:MAG: hypothetical protein IJZ68_07155 [Bacteroidaceae bacterium]|nr:hypothetical protein [Bacteroidaceae bacterium]
MKKTLLIISVIAFVVAMTLLIIGFCCSNPPAEKTPNETLPPSINTPTEPTPFEIPAGKYYYIMGTHTAYGSEDSELEDASQWWPYIAWNNNQYIFNAMTGVINGTATVNGNIIVFDNISAVQQAMPISVEHDELWYTIYYPQQEKAWECTYDTNTKTITIAHNADFVTFQYFETPEDYVQYLRDTFLKDGYIEIYPAPKANITTEGTPGQN